MLLDMYPGWWDAKFGGHLLQSDTYLNNAIKEVNEELGLQIAEDYLILFEVYKSEKEKEFQAVYYTEWDGDLKSISLEEEEVDRVEWKDIEELEEIFMNKEPQWIQHGYELRLLKHLKSRKHQ